MIKIAHRINSIAELKNIPSDFGVEIDVRHDNRNNSLYLNHDPGTGDSLEEYLKNFRHHFIIFDIKEAGIEQHCIDLAAKYSILTDNYFLLDVEFPYLYKASRQESIKQIAVRFSEAEPIEFADAQRGFVDWVWIDTNSKLPLDALIVEKLKSFKTCLVSPDRWGRPEDILVYKQKMKDLNFKLDAVMCGIEHMDLWN